MQVKRILAFASLFLGLLVGFYVLPYQYSAMKPIDENNLSSEYDPSELGVYLGKSVTSSFIAPKSLTLNVLGVNDSEKRIEVDLTNQRLYAYEGDTKVYDFLISSGKWAPTPTGEYNIWVKLRYTKMEGGNKAWGTYYYLPNVPYVMYFYNDQTPKHRGFGLHGTYWHNNFGHPMSHGCVNMRTEDAEKLYYWTGPDLRGKSSIYASDDNPGTRIVIYGETPKE